MTFCKSGKIPRFKQVIFHQSWFKFIENSYDSNISGKEALYSPKHMQSESDLKFTVNWATSPGALLQVHSGVRCVLHIINSLKFWSHIFGVYTAPLI